MAEGATTRNSVHPLEEIFYPRGIAVIGASARIRPGGQGAIGQGFLMAIREMGFQGGLYPVNPNYPEVMGLKCYPTLLDVPGPVDHVIFSVRAHLVPQILDHCIEKGVRSIHFFTAGFHETGDEERARLEQEIISRLRQAGIRVIGPNCMGLYCPETGLSFMPGFPTQPGNVAFISQSGANAGDFVRTGEARGLRYSKVISYGNASDLTESDFFEYCAADPKTDIIGAYIEGVKDGRRFLEVLREAASRKPVVILKGGRTEAGGRAANSHTGSLAGSIAVFDALCRQLGAVRVESMDELVDTVVAFRYLKPPAGRNVCLVGGGGGTAVLASDDVAAAGLEVPHLPESVQEKLREFTPIAGTSVRNPIDSNVIFDVQSLQHTLRLAATAANIDMIIYYTGAGWGPPRGGDFDPSRRLRESVSAMKQVREESGKPIIIVARTPLDARSMEATVAFQERCWQEGFPVFPSVSRAVRAVARMMEWHGRHNVAES